MRVEEAEASDDDWLREGCLMAIGQSDSALQKRQQRKEERRERRKAEKERRCSSSTSTSSIRVSQKKDKHTVDIDITSDDDGEAVQAVQRRFFPVQPQHARAMDYVLWKGVIIGGVTIQPESFRRLLIRSEMIDDSIINSCQG